MPLVNLTYRRIVAALMLGCPLLLNLAACDSSVEQKIALARLAQTCLVNSDCTTPLVCAFEACHAECESSRDCESGARCVAAARPYKVCQLEEERACATTADCAEALVCGVDGECRDSCSSNNDCVEGQLCVAGTCADTNELGDDGQLVPAPGAVQGSEGTPCVYVSDCAAALLCRSQSCLPQCKADKDCPVHQQCQDTRCVADGSQPLACNYHSDCETERGERCLAGNCRCICAEDRDCPNGQRCDGCGCEPAPGAPAPCVYNSDCQDPGQVCKNRACACECKADADCGQGSRCDGCGCISALSPLDGIISGSVFVESSLQLPLYRGVTEIRGSLIVTSSQMVDLGDTFDELRSVEGQIVISDNQLLERISFPALEQTQAVVVSNSPKAKQLELPALETAYLDLNTLPLLQTLSLESWESGTFQAYNLGLLKQLSLPALKELQSFQLNESFAVEQVSMPKLSKLRGSFTISGNTKLALQSLLAPALTVIGEKPYAGPLRIQNTQLADLSGFGGAPLTVGANSVQLLDNTLLNRCAIEVFVARLKSGGLELDPNLSGNAPCTSCSGGSCVD